MAGKQTAAPKSKPPVMKIILWCLVGIMAMSGVMFFPSFASIFMFVFAVLAAPIGPVQRFLESRGLRGLLKGALLVVVFIVGVVLAPLDRIQTDAPADGVSLSAPEGGEVDKEAVKESKPAAHPVPDADDADAESSEPVAEPEPPVEEPQEAQTDNSPPAESPDADAASDESAVELPSADTEAPAEPVPEPPADAPASEPPAAAGPVEDQPEAPAAEPDPDAAFRESLLQYNYVGSTESDKYHYPRCRWTSNIHDWNLIHFDTVDEAKASGYSPCGTCEPR